MSENRIYVIPTAGLSIPDPATRKPLPATGAWVVHDQYWRRRLRDREIVQGTPPIVSQAPAPSTTAGDKS